MSVNLPSLNPSEILNRTFKEVYSLTNCFTGNTLSGQTIIRPLFGFCSIYRNERTITQSAEQGKRIADPPNQFKRSGAVGITLIRNRMNRENPRKRKTAPDVKQYRAVIGMTPTEFRLRESRQAGTENAPDAGRLTSPNRDTWRRQQ